MFYHNQSNMKQFILALLLPALTYAQSDIETVIRGSEILLTGLTAIKLAKADPYDKTVANVCVKNKLEDKITFTLCGNTEDGDTINKELVIAKGGKECLFKLPKGIYTYVVALSDGIVYKKGEYDLQSGETIVVKNE